MIVGSGDRPGDRGQAPLRIAATCQADGGGTARSEAVPDPSGGDPFGIDPSGRYRTGSDLSGSDRFGIGTGAALQSGSAG